jgi:outer membrane protein OmpA-like peptidoglycan-associated protein
MKLTRLFLMSAALLLVMLPIAAAEQSNKDLDPTFTGETGLFTIFLGDTLPQGMFSGGLVYNNYDRETTDFDTNVWNLVFGYGILDNLEIAASFAPITQVVFRNWELGETLNSHPHSIRTIENGVGDLRVGLKYRLIDDIGASPAVAIRAFAKIPTAEYEGGFGSGAVDFGANLIVSKSFTNTFEAAANLGYTIIGEPEDFGDCKLSDELSYGLGFGWLLEPKMKIKFLGELKGIAYMNDDEYPQAAPMDVFVGFQKRFEISPKYDLRFGLGYQVNVAFDTDVANNQHGAGMMLTIGPSANLVPVISEVKGERTATCVGAPIGLVATATDDNDDTLMYTWTVNGETIPGSESSVSWTPSSPGDYKVVVTVDDGRRGGVATQEMTVKAYPAPTVSLSINSDVVYVTKKYTVTASITNPGDYPLAYFWKVNIGTITPNTNQAEATWDLTNATDGEATITLNVKSEIGCDVNTDLKIKVEKDPCAFITDADLAGEVHFPFNKYILREPTEEAYKIFDRVIEKMKLCDTLVIRFEGHCCYIGTKDYNMCLGWWRTETVVKYFVEHGIDRARISTISYGKEKPKYDNNTEKTRQWNRRVMIMKDNGEAVPTGTDKDNIIEKCKTKYNRWLK